MLPLRGESNQHCKWDCSTQFSKQRPLIILLKFIYNLRVATTNASAPRTSEQTDDNKNCKPLWKNLSRTSHNSLVCNNIGDGRNSKCLAFVCATHTHNVQTINSARLHEMSKSKRAHNQKHKKIIYLQSKCQFSLHSFYKQFKLIIKLVHAPEWK